MAQVIEVCLASERPRYHQKKKNPKIISKLFCFVLGFELRASHLLGRHSTT
jgi:hypothetical protein